MALYSQGGGFFVAGQRKERKGKEKGGIPDTKEQNGAAGRAS